MSQCVLITGASGFLGSHLVSAFLQTGYKVLAYKRKSTDLWRLNGLTEQVVWFNIEDGLDIPFKEYTIDHIIHTATCYGRSNESIHELVQANLFFPLSLFELALTFKVKTFINADTVLNGFLNAYALSKHQLREWLKIFAKKIKVINVRLEHFYGPKDDSNKFISYVIDKCISGDSKLELTKGEQKRDFIFIDDVVNAFLCILNKSNMFKKGFNEFIVGFGEPITIKKLVETIAKLTETNIKLLFGALPYKNCETAQYNADILSIKKLGWLPLVSLTEGLQATIDYQIGELK